MPASAWPNPDSSEAALAVAGQLEEVVAGHPVEVVAGHPAEAAPPPSSRSSARRLVMADGPAATLVAMPMLPRR